MNLDEEIINKVLQFLYNGDRECSFSDLKMIPSDKSTRIKDKLTIDGLIEKTPRQFTSNADNYTLTNKAIKIILDHESYQNYIKNKHEEKPNTGFININASSGSFVNLATGNNNTLIQNLGEIEKIYADLEALGVSKSQLNRLKEIAETEVKENTPAESKRKKLMDWLVSMTTEFITTGIKDKIPAIISAVEKLIAKYTNP